MSRSPRKTYHHGDLRRAILEAARELLDREGPSALSFRRLAEAVDVSHAAPLAHFPDRLSLDAALAAQGFRELATQCEHLRAPVAFAAPAVPALSVSRRPEAQGPGLPASSGKRGSGLFAMRLVTAALMYLRFALEHPGLYAVMSQPELGERLRQSEPGEEGEPALRELLDEKTRAFSVFVELVRKGQAAGELRRDIAPESAGRLVAALAEGLAHQYLSDRRGMERLREAEALFESLLRGLEK